VTVTVKPAEFTLVQFDAERIAAIVGDVAARLGLPGHLDIAVDVDERSPLARTLLTSIDPPVLTVEGGAFEEPRWPRRMSEEGVATTAARLLGRVVDRREPAFGPAPAEADLTLAQADAWDAYSLGRASRRGIETHQPRWRYRFRMRHGFTDVSDRVFDRLWLAERLTWADLDAACAETAASPASAGTPA
jgi:hypothetical protein